MKALALLCLGFVICASARANEGTAFFDSQVLPILRNRCYECHSSEHGIKGGLALDSRAGWENGGDHGPALTPRNLKQSALIQAIHHLDPDSAMPPKKKLSTIEIALLETWVLMGAPDPRSETENNGQRTK